MLPMLSVTDAVASNRRFHDRVDSASDWKTATLQIRSGWGLPRSDALPAPRDVNCGGCVHRPPIWSGGTMDSHGCLCCRYIVVSMQRRGFPPPRVLCPMVSSMGNALSLSMRRLSTVQTRGGKCAPVDGIDQCRSISSRRSSCSAPCSSNDCTRTLPRLLRMRSRELVVLILHYLFCGEAFPPRGPSPLCLLRQVHATGGGRL